MSGHLEPVPGTRLAGSAILFHLFILSYLQNNCINKYFKKRYPARSHAHSPRSSPLNLLYFDYNRSSGWSRADVAVELELDLEFELARSSSSPADWSEVIASTTAEWFEPVQITGPDLRGMDNLSMKRWIADASATVLVVTQITRM